MMPMGIFLTLAALGFTGGRQIATSGSSTPRGGLKRLLAFTPEHPPWQEGSRPAPVDDVVLAASSFPTHVPLPMAAAGHGSTVPSAVARTTGRRLAERPPPILRLGQPGVRPHPQRAP